LRRSNISNLLKLKENFIYILIFVRVKEFENQSLLNGQESSIGGCIV